MKNAYLIIAASIVVALGLASQVMAASTAPEAQTSAADIAKELTNPATDKSTLNFNFEYTTYRGALPNSSGQDSFIMSFQPAFPFSLGDGRIFAVRPLIPFNFSRPVFNTGKSDFDDESSLIGDITTDIFYGKTYKSGWVLGGGAVTVLPTATDEKLAGKSFNAGPEVLIVKLDDWGAAGILATHQWDVTGWNDDYVSLSSLQYIYSFLLDEGWSITASPTITYNWAAESRNKWAVPVGSGLSKTSVIGGKPWKFAFEAHYYVQQQENFGADWLFKLKISPIVPNPFSDFFKAVTK